MNQWIPFLDARAHVFNNGQPAANAGVGARYLTSSLVYGVNTYYDYRKTVHDHYNQVSIGLEAMTERWDFRLNGYVPVGSKKSGYYKSRFSHFKGNYAYLSSKREFAMYGSNFEASYHITKWKDIDIQTAFGPYYFYNQSKNAVGGEVRVSAKFYDMVKLTASGSYDPVFKGIGQGEIGFIIPFGPRGKVKSKNANCKKQLLLHERALQNVERNEIIVADAKRYHSLAINPTTGAPYKFYFVNNLSHSLGTFESPYPTVQEAAAKAGQNDVIYVYQGSGASYNTGASGLALQDGQYLWGASTNQTLPTTLGSVTISPQSEGLPTFTGGNNTHAVITLGNNNEVSGLHITGVNSNYAIEGGDLANFTYSIFNPFIANNWIDGTFSTQSSIAVVPKGETYIIGNRVTWGLYVLAAGTDQLNIYIGDNVVNTSVSSAAAIFGVSVTSNNNSSVQAHIYSNDISLSNSGAGALFGVLVSAGDQSKLVVNTSTNNVSVTSTNVNGPVGFFILSGDQSSLHLFASQNQVYVEAQEALSATGMFLRAGSNSSQMVDVSLNSITTKNLGAGQAYAMQTISEDTGVLQGRIYSNWLYAESSAALNQSWGVFSQASGSSQYSIDVYSNRIISKVQQSASYGIDLKSIGDTSSLSANIYQNKIDTQGQSTESYGIRAWSVTGASPSISANIFNNVLDVVANATAQGAGVIAQEDTGSANANIEGNTGVVRGSSKNKSAVIIQGGVSGTQGSNTIVVE
jgi:hypothetical protein